VNRTIRRDERPRHHEFKLTRRGPSLATSKASNGRPTEAPHPRLLSPGGTGTLSPAFARSIAVADREDFTSGRAPSIEFSFNERRASSVDNPFSDSIRHGRMS
jgi:hypothetical protein